MLERIYDIVLFNGKSGHKAKSSTLSTQLRNAIDIDAVDTERSQAETLAQLLELRKAALSLTCHLLPDIAIVLRSRGPSMSFIVHLTYIGVFFP